MTEAFARDLIPVRGHALERGDPVYETVKFGTRPEDVKLKKLRVLDTDRGSALVAPYDGTPGEKKAQQRRVQFAHLRMEPRAEAKQPDTRPRAKLMPPASEPPPPSTKPAPASKASSADDQYEAWAEMGRELLAGINGEIAGLTEHLTKISADLEALDTRHRRTIEELEQELLEARRAHEEDRALAAARREALSGRLERAKERLKGIRSMLGESADV